MNVKEVLDKLNYVSDARFKEGMKNFGINTEKALGISVLDLRKIAKEIGIDHTLAQKLWRTGVHEARILATMIDDPALVTDEQMETWVKDINSWDLCDSCCGNLFMYTYIALKKPKEWCKRNEEFVKRAGFSMIANLAAKNKKMTDNEFIVFLPFIKESSGDERNFVKKAVNWALREIGKRNKHLNKIAIEAAEQIKENGDPNANWVATNALNELRNQKIQRRFK